MCLFALIYLCLCVYILPSIYIYIYILYIYILLHVYIDENINTLHIDGIYVCVFLFSPI